MTNFYNAERCCGRKDCHIFSVQLEHNEPCCMASEFQWVPDYPSAQCSAWFHNSAQVEFDCKEIRDLYEKDENIGVTLYSSFSEYDFINQSNIAEQTREDGDTFETQDIITAGNLTLTIYNKTVWHYNEELEDFSRTYTCKVTANGKVLCERTSEGGLEDTSSEGYDEDPANAYPTLSIIKKGNSVEAFYKNIYIGPYYADYATCKATARYTGTDKYLKGSVYAEWTIPDREWLYEDLNNFSRYATLTNEQLEQLRELSFIYKQEHRGCPCPKKIPKYKYIAKNLPRYSRVWSRKWDCGSLFYSINLDFNATKHEWLPCPDSCCRAPIDNPRTLAYCIIGLSSSASHDIYSAECTSSNIIDPWEERTNHSGDIIGALTLYQPVGNQNIVAHNYCLDIPYGETYKFEWAIDTLLENYNLRILSGPEYGSATIRKTCKCTDDDCELKEFKYTLIYRAPVSLPKGTCITQLSYEVTGMFGEKSIGYITFRHYKPSDNEEEEELTTEYDLLNDGTESSNYEEVSWIVLKGAATGFVEPSILESFDINNTWWGFSGNGTDVIGWTANLYKIGDSTEYKFVEGVSLGNYLVQGANCIYVDDPTEYFRQQDPNNLIDHLDVIRGYNELKSKLRNIVVQEVEDTPKSKASCESITLLTNAVQLCSDINVKELTVSMTASVMTRHTEITTTYPEGEGEIEQEIVVETTEPDEIGTYTVIIDENNNPSASFNYNGQPYSNGVILSPGNYDLSWKELVVSTYNEQESHEEGSNTYINSYDETVLLMRISGTNVTWKE